ncbi:MAG: EscU/YscU/HrcU family type III secretion system export apparatus switch protein [Geminicoccaceae bacterium]
MADDHDPSQKTEEPTQRRLDEAREEGRVVATPEIGNAVLVAIAALAAGSAAAPAAARLAGGLRGWLAAAGTVSARPSDLAGALLGLLGDLALTVLAPLALVAVALAASSWLQHGPLWSPAALRPQAARISPLAGLGRLFSAHALAELARGVVKLAAVGAIAWWIVGRGWPRILGTAGQEPAGLLAVTGAVAAELLVAIAALAAVVAALDWLWRRHAFLQQMRMSRQEVLDEQKHTDGDPVVKQRLRAIRLARARRRMMADVPKSTVVLTNPTHFAVALRYDAVEAPVPVVVAKGVDRVARKIRETAARHGVPVVENPPLARLLHAAVEIGQPIRPAHFKAVAEVVGYVMRLRRPGAAGR